MLDEIIDKGKTALVMGLSATMLYGCVPAQNVNEEFPRRYSETFIFSYLEDVDKSGILGDNDEDFVNRDKYIFKKGEEMAACMISSGFYGGKLRTYVTGPDGNKIKCLIDGNENLVTVDTITVSHKDQLTFATIDTRQLQDGDYIIYWKINGLPRGRNTFTIIK